MGAVGLTQGFEIVVDGTTVQVSDERLTLLEVLREQLGVRSAKDGCSPQGQCGCCTVLVDGQPRVACVTPARRVRGRHITTLEGLDPEIRDRWSRAFSATGGSQCGFCTPGIICRLAALDAKGADHDDRAAAARALAAHLCRCTGWQPIIDAWVAYPSVARDGTGVAADSSPERSRASEGSAGEYADAARPVGTGGRSSDSGSAGGETSDNAVWRASIEGRSAQTVGAHVALGRGGFADDTVPVDALVAVRAGERCEAADEHGWVVASTLAEARRLAARVPGRRTTAEWASPLRPPPGDWAATLQTSWVEPGYLETDAAWCEPGGEPASALGNGGAFGAKRGSPVEQTARRLADRHDRPVRVIWSRPDTVELGPKRPPLAAGVRSDGSGSVLVARTPGISEAIRAYAPKLEVTEVDLAGPPTSAQIRAAGWAEAAALLAAARGEVGWIKAPEGGKATAAVEANGTIAVTVRAGRILDETVLRSYCTGAAHMAYSWVTSESLSVDPKGAVHDLTIRSFGIVSAAAMPPVSVTVADEDRDPLNGSDAVFAAVAAAVWLHQGVSPTWPTGRAVTAEAGC